MGDVYFTVEQIERVRMATSEAGWTSVIEDDPDIGRIVVWDPAPPLAVLEKALALAGAPVELDPDAYAIPGPLFVPIDSPSRNAHERWVEANGHSFIPANVE